MIMADIEKFFENWAPRSTAWERDNVGIQVGRRSRKVSNILLALDVTPAIVQEAVDRKADLIVTHHPLLFHPPLSISDADAVGTLVLYLAEKRIALFSAHTNLDSASGGVSFSLAETLGVAHPRFLAPLKDSMAKIAVFVPQSHVRAVTAAMAESGAGIIGEYQACSFQLSGKGTFRGSSRSKPAIGKPLRPEVVDEIRLEMMAPRARIRSVIEAMKSVHPYEEVAYDVYALLNGNPNAGMGAIGDLPKPTTVRSFLANLKKALRINSVRVSGPLDRAVKRVAVCGGSGSEHLEDAIRAKADVFVTADIRYHTFQAAEDRITLVDAGHYETEYVVLPAIVQRLRSWAKDKGENIIIAIAKNSTNPIHYL